MKKEIEKNFEEYKNKIEQLEKELKDMKTYMRIKRNNFVACIREHIDYTSPLLWEKIKRVEWLDDDDFCVNSFEITDYFLEDNNEIYQNDKGELFIKTYSNQEKERYYKINTFSKTLERVYFEGKKTNLGKKIW